ncbi:MAG: hypothetical protein KY464_12460 [Gemmatimonadetes bacterium]|nr:hypothetical protein [Gemmatimonadota bacterium]
MLVGLSVVEVLLPLLRANRPESVSAEAPAARARRFLPTAAPALVLLFLVGHSSLAAATGLKKSPSALVG